MASGNLKDIKRRVKSVNNTMKITKAMELVASSKLKKAKDRLEQSKPFFDTLYRAMVEISENNKDFTSIYTRNSAVDANLYIVIAGDRGLAGGYNSNLLKLASSEIRKEKDCVVALGNKSKDFFTRHGYEVVFVDVSTIEEVEISDLSVISTLITDLFQQRKVGGVKVIYTNLITSLSQEPVLKDILPLMMDKTNKEPVSSELIIYEPSAEEVFNQIIPSYLTGIIYGALVEAYASEQSARRNAMESANDNAKDIIEKLDILYNRARQSAITQEISEIVGGAEALS